MGQSRSQSKPLEVKDQDWTGLSITTQTTDKAKLSLQDYASRWGLGFLIFPEDTDLFDRSYGDNNSDDGQL